MRTLRLYMWTLVVLAQVCSLGVQTGSVFAIICTSPALPAATFVCFCKSTLAPQVNFVPDEDLSLWCGSDIYNPSQPFLVETVVSARAYTPTRSNLGCSAPLLSLLVLQLRQCVKFCSFQHRHHNSVTPCKHRLRGLYSDCAVAFAEIIASD